MLIAPGLAMIVLLTGCVTGDDNDQDTTGQSTGVDAEGGSRAGELPAELSGPPVLGPVVWSTGVQPDTNEPVGVVSTFTDDSPVIYAVFPIERLPGGTTIRASWTYNGTSLDGMETEVTASEDQLRGWLEFHLKRSNQDPWPDGRYAISLTSGEVLVATGEVALTGSV